MPYTPPSQRSPATSVPSSPVITRNQSFESSPQQAERPGLPRSRSATYLQKHRRSPSLLESIHSHSNDTAHHAINGHSQSFLIHHHGHDRIDSSEAAISDSPSRALPDLIIPGEGSTASPSESMGSEEDDYRVRGRKLEEVAVKLRETVVPKRGRSPPRIEEGKSPAAPRPTPALDTNNISSPRLTPEALKITHSRSTSALELSKFNTEIIPVIHGSSESDNDDDEDLLIKPPLIRKKSGELVKPALRPTGGIRRRPSSMPGTPTYSKAVHFNEDIEQVRHFLQVDRPMAVSAGSSPAEGNYDSDMEYPFGKGGKARSVEWEIRTANFPRETIERLSLPVRVEKIYLSSDNKTLVGNVAVANISFHKSVVARFTFDYWNTTSEVAAEFDNDVRKKVANDGFDRFNFSIKLADQANLETKTLLLCVRYNVEGREFWDNNNSINFQVDFVKKIAPKVAKRPGMQGLSSAGSTGSIPRSRHSPNGRPRSLPAGADDDFSQGFGFMNEDPLLRDPPTVLKLRNNSSRKGSLFPSLAQRAQVNQAFSTRYDFSASLTAALQNAQNALGEQSGLTPRTAPVQKQHVATKSSAPAVQPVDGPRPDKIFSERPDLHSAEYNDLIQKFCYFGTGGKSSPAGIASPLPVNEKPSGPKDDPLPQADGSTAVPDSSTGSPEGSPMSSASNSPPSPRHSFQLDGTSDHHNIRSTTPPFHPISPRLIPFRSPSPGVGSSYQDYPFQGLAPQSAQC